MKKSDLFILGSALASMILSIYFWFMVDKDAGLFIGIWVPSLLGFGNYIKMKQGELNG
ncbi:MAG: hypothetical protein RLN90_04360 [Balneolaceae bacterium]